MNDFKRMQKLAGIITESQLNEADLENYMFFSNLKQMKRQIEMIMEMDPAMVDGILQNGHDWADDHISEAKNNMDQVFDFLKNEMDGNYTLNEAEEVMSEKLTFTDYDKWLKALYDTHPFIKGNEDKYFTKSKHFVNVSRGLQSFGYWYDGKAADPEAKGTVTPPYDVSSQVYPQGSRKD